jgi:hypothetical protein
MVVHALKLVSRIHFLHFAYKRFCIGLECSTGLIFAENLVYHALQLLRNIELTYNLA